MAEKGIMETWFEANKRDFPWRRDPTPYRVWISEVMLQQTRASVVVPYFLRWMDLFPNVKRLYMAPIEQVIKAWEGLGYYSRARNIHAAAKQIVEEFGGEMPDAREALLSLPGFGAYTTGAVLSFGFHKRAAAVDGNVLRVLSRYFLIEENVSKTKVRRKIEEKAEAMLDPSRPWVTAEALIELGATVCLPQPLCEDCPLSKGCLALQAGKADALPIKNEERGVTSLRRTVFVIEHEGCVLVRKGERGKVMADLYEFPYIEAACGRGKVVDSAHSFVGGELVFVRKLTERQHTFTRYKANLSPYLIRARRREASTGYEWVPIVQISDLPFSSGHRKIASEVT